MRSVVLESPVGSLTAIADGTVLIGVRFGAVAGAPASTGDPALSAAAEQLGGYFSGARTAFTVPLEIRGGSAFERAVWGEIARIPYGETVTYGAIAAALGEPGAARAVGTACNRNPVPVIVPCHRVVGAGAKLVGFGGGLDRKRRLLELEARVTLQHAWG
jgi:methylated-DNA-[protein]-cysteine S-methyltransferase